jgi:uncharacterized membrane protein
MDFLDVLRAALGFTYVLFIPGFVASWALFPRRGDLTDMDRLGLCFGLSIALSALPVMFLNYLGVPVNVQSVFLIILSVILVCGLTAFLRIREVN